MKAEHCFFYKLKSFVQVIRSADNIRIRISTHFNILRIPLLNWDTIVKKFKYGDVGSSILQHARGSLFRKEYCFLSTNNFNGSWDEIHMGRWRQKRIFPLFLSESHAWEYWKRIFRKLHDSIKICIFIGSSHGKNGMFNIFFWPRHSAGHHQKYQGLLYTLDNSSSNSSP